MKIFDIVRTEEGNVGYIITENIKTKNFRPEFERVWVRFTQSKREQVYVSTLKKIGRVKRLHPIKL